MSRPPDINLLQICFLSFSITPPLWEILVMAVTAIISNIFGTKFFSVCSLLQQRPQPRYNRSERLLRYSVYDRRPSVSTRMGAHVYGSDKVGLNVILIKLGL